MTSELNVYISLLSSFSKWCNVPTRHTVSNHVLGIRPDPSSLHANRLPLHIRDSIICSLCSTWVGVLEPAWTATANWTAFSRKFTHKSVSSLTGTLHLPDTPSTVWLCKPDPQGPRVCASSLGSPLFRGTGLQDDFQSHVTYLLYNTCSFCP